jgi:hypothetical protein
MNHHILTGKLDITSNLLVGSSHLFVDTDNNRVGLVTADPQAGLHVNSNVYVNTDLRVGPAGANQVIINDSTNPGRIVAKSFVGDGSGLQNTPPGPQGDAATIDVGTVTTGVPGSSASVTNSGTTNAATLDFTIPRGDTGAQGSTGDAATISVGTVTTGVPGSSASVTNSGTTNAATLDFTIPRGDTGAQGSTGDAATISFGTVTTGVPGSSASVTNSGTTNAATLDFTIPRGDTGATIFTEDGDDIYRQTGNVGIGTSTPTEKIHIKDGSIRLDSTGTVSIINKHDTSDYGVLSLDAGYRGGSSRPKIRIVGYQGQASVNGDNLITFHTNGSERMKINQDGNVGIGTTYPEGAVHISVDSDNGNATTNALIIGGPTGCGGNTNLRIGCHNDYAWMQSHCGNPLSMNPLGNNVGIGISNPKAKLHVNGIGGYSIGNISGYQRRWWHFTHGILDSSNDGWANDVSIYANRDIMSGDHFVSHNGSFTSSDQRIKKDIVDVDDASALESLKLLKPKKYKYKDTISRGEDPVWGFIAQEVRETLPYATRLRQDFIPNIYELSNVSDSNVITFSSFNTSNLEKTTSNLRLKCIDGNDKEVSIVEVIDETKIRVNEDLSECIGAVDESGNVVSGNQIFVYGEEVDDFVFLKKEIFIPICVSSIQELDRRLEADKTRIVELETQQQSDKARIVELETQLQSEKSKIATMELLVASLVTRVGDLERSLI